RRREVGRPDVGRDAVHGNPLQPRRAGGADAVEERRRPVTRRVVALVLALVTAVVTGTRPSAPDPITTKVTYAREIRAILDTHCTICHAPGGSAPMPFATYEDVRPWARAIKDKALAREMPKWHAARGYGAFANDPTLTPFELALVVAWADGGQP